LKKLRKLFAVATVTAMLLTLMASGAAAATVAAPAFPDIAGVDHADALTLLNLRGIYKGYPDGTAGPDRPITRAEFAAVVVRALGKETLASAFASTTPTFTDADATWAWAWGYVNVATNAGIIQGYPDGTFGPSRNVTHAEALAMLIRAIGHEGLATGIWPMKYIAYAYDMGLNAGVDIIANLPATRAEVARLAVNAMRTGMWKGAKDSQGNPVFVASLLGDYEKTGTVSNVTGTTITLTGAGAGTYNLASQVQLFGVDRLDALVNLSVKLVFDKKTTATDPKVSFIEVVTVANTLAGTFEKYVAPTATDTNAYVQLSDGSKHPLKQGTGGAVTATFSVNQSAPATVDIAAATGLRVQRLDSVVLTFDSGRVTFINATRVDAKNLIVSSRDTTAKTVTTTTTYPGVTGITYGVFNVANAAITINGAAAALADLKANDVVNITTQGAGTVVTSGGGSFVTLKVEATRNTVQGTVTQVVTASDGTRTVTVKLADGTTKDVVLLSQVTTTPSVNTVVKYGLNADGKAAVAIGITDPAADFVKVTNSSKIVATTTTYTITVDRGGSAYTYTLDSTVFPNGYTGSLNVVGKLQISGTTGKVTAFDTVAALETAGALASAYGKVYSVDTANNVITVDQWNGADFLNSTGPIRVTATAFASYTDSDTAATVAVGAFRAVSDYAAGDKVLYYWDTTTNKIVYILRLTPQ